MMKVCPICSEKVRIGAYFGHVLNEHPDALKPGFAQIEKQPFTAEMAKVVAQQERERIIKLLEESDSVCNQWAIAFIKGENK